MPKGTHGGARPGAGRKPHRLKYRFEIETFTAKAAKDIASCYENLKRLADGVPHVVEETYETVFSARAKLKGEPSALDAMNPLDMILVERKVTTPAPDRLANEYIINRVLGRCASQSELMEEETPERAPLDLSALNPQELNAFRLITNKLVHDQRNALSQSTHISQGVPEGHSGV